MDIHSVMTLVGLFLIALIGRFIRVRMRGRGLYLWVLGFVVMAATAAAVGTLYAAR